MVQKLMFNVEVVYINSQQQFRKTLIVAEDTNVRQVIESSQVLALFKEINLSENKVGIFSKLVALDKIVKAGDRIEIYQPLIIDPMQARIQRAKQQKAIKLKK